MVAFALGAADETAAAMEKGFKDPPMESRIRAYWWWLNGNVTKQAITRDLEEMKKQGWGGALICDAGGAEQRGNRQVPAGPKYGSPAWRELFVHAVKEADRLGLEMSTNIMSGWNLGGPTVTPEEAAKCVVWSETKIEGGKPVDVALPEPKHDKRFYRDIAVVAYPLKKDLPKRPPIRDLAAKTASKEYGGSCPDTTPLLFDETPVAGEEDCLIKDVVDLTKFTDSGRLKWDAPAGEWVVMRFGYSITGAKTSTSSVTWSGLVIDYMDADALRSYWRQVVEPILADASPWAGKSLKHLQTDSWELGGINWTKDFAAEFRRRREYEITPWLPVITGKIVENRSVANRFLNDFRRTVGDLVADKHYAVFAELAAKHHLGIDSSRVGRAARGAARRLAMPRPRRIHDDGILGRNRPSTA